MKCAVLGDPIAHSLSPVLHRAGYAALGLDWSYEAIRVSSGGLRELLATTDSGWRGLSLTMPLKREAMPIADRVTERAALVGAANTLLLADGLVHADNTDLPGAVAALRERYDGPVTSATILGAGATAASTGLALCDLGASSITLLARSAERAQQTVAAIARHPSAPRLIVGSLDDEPVGEVLVSTVPASAQTLELVKRCQEIPVVFEVLYDPWPTPLAASVGGVVAADGVGGAGGRILVGGFDLLLHQAGHQFELFTGRQAPLAAMRLAGETALAQRRTDA